MNTLGQLIKTGSQQKKPSWKTGRLAAALQMVGRQIGQFLLAFFLSRTSIFLRITPLAVSSYLGLGGGFFPWLGAIGGSFSLGMYSQAYRLILAFFLKSLFREEKWDVWYLIISHTAVDATLLYLREPAPQDVIVAVVSLLLAVSGYFLIKKAYRAQFVKSRALKFSKEEAYCSLFLLFSLLSGIQTENVLFLINASDILKIYLIAMAAFYFGIGGGAAAGAVVGILSGYKLEYSAVCMSVYALFGFFTGLFSKFAKLSALLGLWFSYVFSAMYFHNAMNLVSPQDVLIAGVLFYLTPKKWIHAYLDRYAQEGLHMDVIGTMNSITVNRLDKLAKSFSGLSQEITHTKKSIRTMTQVNESTLYDFVGERLCRHCSLKNSCWQEHYSDTADALTKGITHLARYGQLEEKNFSSRFRNRCIKPEKMAVVCKNFYEIHRLNAVWKHKLSENTAAFQTQFLELSKIICELKQNIESNRYFDAALSQELYSALGNEGYPVREALVLMNAAETYYVRLELTPCKYNETCFPTLAKIIEDVIGVPVTRTEGGCGERVCRLLFCEGESLRVEKRIQSISKKDADPVGDSCLISQINRNQYLMALADGMGTGKEASRISTSVITLLDEMLKAGFSGEAAYQMLNSFLIASCAGTSTLDFVLIDLKKMTAKMVKTGACPTYLKRQGEVIEIANLSPPAGIGPAKPFTKTLHLEAGDMLYMISDGVIEATDEKEWVYRLLQKTPSDQLTETVDMITALAQRDFEQRSDDITVMGLKILPL